MNYRYRKVGNYLVPLGCSVKNALQTFWLGYSRFGIDSLGVSRAIAKKIIKVIILGKIRPADPAQVISLPVSAILGMQVHHGYKMFDFEKNEVTKVFSQDYSTAKAGAEIQAAKQASSVIAAPRFIEAEANSRWFTEEYIAGTHATTLVTRGSSDFQQFYADAEKCLLDLQSSMPVVDRPVDQHLKYLVETPFHDRWLTAGAPASEIDEIARYQQSLRSWIMDDTDNETLQLVATHGDFSLVNAIVTREGLRFIDWESVSPGGVFTDIYNFAIVERYYGRTSSNWSDEMRALLERFRSVVGSLRSDLTDSIEMSDRLARRIYYLERLRFLVDRDVTTNLRQVTQKTIELFRQIDVDMRDSTL